MSELDHKVLFLISEGQDGAPIVTLGIPTAAWEYMKDGKTHIFDLTKAGIPVKLMLFGAPDHESAMKMITEGAAANGITVTDERGKDFSIKPKT